MIPTPSVYGALMLLAVALGIYSGSIHGVYTHTVL